MGQQSHSPCITINLTNANQHETTFSDKVSQQNGPQKSLLERINDRIDQSKREKRMTSKGSKRSRSGPGSKERKLKKVRSNKNVIKLN